MEYRKLGSSGLDVSVVGLGTNNFGRRLDYEGSERVVRAALDEGVNTIDTSNSYGDSLSEEYIGRALEGRRSEAVVATKVATSRGDGPNMAAHPGSTSSTRSREACGASGRTTSTCTRSTSRTPRRPSTRR